MYKLKPSISLRYFGLKWLDDGKYQITQEDKEFEHYLSLMKDSGFEAIELVSAGCWNKQEEEANLPFITEAVKKIKDSGLTFQSVHIPFSLPWWDFAAIDENQRRLAIDTYKWAVDSFKGDLPNLFVIHPGERPKTPEERPYKLENLAKSMLELCEFSPRPVCVENMVNQGLLNKISEAKDLLNAVPKLNMTIDINHSLLQKPEEYIAEIGSRVKNLHISDNDGTDERHWLPGKGIINFNAILSTLEKVGYNGTFNYEVGLAKNGLTPIDVKDNFDKLFSDYNNLK